MVMLQTNTLSSSPSISRPFCLNQQAENMLSFTIPSRVNTILTTSSLSTQTSCSKSFKTPILVNNRTSFVGSSIILRRNSKPISRNYRQVPFAAPEALTAEATTEEAPPSAEPAQVPEKVDVVVKQVENTRLVLKFIWMEKNIGLALDQVIPGHGTVPLSPYFFWPRKDAWEELKTTLESKPWISQKKMIILLNQATDIINLWQQSGGNITA